MKESNKDERFRKLDIANKWFLRFTAVALVVLIVWGAVGTMNQEKRIERHEALIASTVEGRQKTAVTWVAEYTKEESDFLHIEQNTGMYAIRSLDGIYRVNVEDKNNTVDYVIYEDKVIYSNK